ncbi:synaptonemal complex central element protein 1-like [Echinops telfairi]|uniref:Synaptonemal complex central element protein 1-like n=1 Tax=Echinops telfairi TaxID=9371 RepID=A0ABM0ZQV8_ECHTE|nr:synaptonemal complex central element protein 1-like [Echinops telfairi]
MEHTSGPGPQMAQSDKQRRLGLEVEEQLVELMGRHRDLWEFHILEQRLGREIVALERSHAQLLTEEMLVRVKLEEVAHQLCSPPDVGTPQAGRWKDKLEMPEGQVPTPAQDAPEEEGGNEDVGRRETEGGGLTLGGPWKGSVGQDLCAQAGDQASEWPAPSPQAGSHPPWAAPTQDLEKEPP